MINLENHHDKVAIKYTQLYVDGEFMPAQEGQTFESISPVSEEKIADIALAGAKDVDLAVSAARAALDGSWGKLSGAKRGRLLNLLADLIEENTEALALLETYDSGKPINDVIHGDIPDCIDAIRYYAGWADKIEGTSHVINETRHCQTIKEPVGVCALIIPWNYPLLMAIWKIAPSLAAGCSVILKPAEQTSLSALKLAALIDEAGFPKGAFNCLTGFGANSTGELLVNHPGVDKVAFTGDGKTAAIIKAQTAASHKRLSFELGGKSPNIIFPDCDFESALQGSIGAIFSNMGQNCCAGSRTFIHQAIYDAFIDAFCEKANQIILGCPFDKKTEHGSQIDKAQFDKIMHYITLGKNSGAKCIAGGERFSEKGFFIKPTVFIDVDNHMQIAREEIFGPVACLIPFKDEQEVLEKANDTPFGLASALWTKDISRAHRMMKKIKAGTVWLNCYNAVDHHVPFGGYKSSGIGRELGKNGLEAYLETKTLTLKI